MHRPGHYGAALLAAIPIVVACRAAGAPLLALVALVGIPALTPLPDWDLREGRLDHRGATHTVAFAGLVGIALATVGWFLPPTLTSVLDQPTISETLDQPTPLPVGVERDLTLVLDHLPPPSPAAWRQPVLSSLGGAVGTIAILAHLAADALTPAGVPLWWPVSDRRVSLGLVGASHRLANYGLLATGTCAAALLFDLHPV